MKETNEQAAVRLRRNIFFSPDVAQRLDALVAAGAVASNIVGVALRQALPTIEKKIESGKEIPGLKIRKEK